jgi:hypothetical protein
MFGFHQRERYVASRFEPGDASNSSFADLTTTLFGSSRGTKLWTKRQRTMRPLLPYCLLIFSLEGRQWKKVGREAAGAARAGDHKPSGPDVEHSAARPGFPPKRPNPGPELKWLKAVLDDLPVQAGWKINPSSGKLPEKKIREKNTHSQKIIPRLYHPNLSRNDVDIRNAGCRSGGREDGQTGESSETSIKSRVIVGGNGNWDVLSVAEQWYFYNWNKLNLILRLCILILIHKLTSAKITLLPGHHHLWLADHELSGYDHKPRFDAPSRREYQQCSQ